jgi:hypothetical protein
MRSDICRAGHKWAFDTGISCFLSLTLQRFGLSDAIMPKKTGSSLLQLWRVLDQARHHQ